MRLILLRAAEVENNQHDNNNNQKTLSVFVGRPKLMIQAVMLLLLHNHFPQATWDCVCVCVCVCVCAREREKESVHFFMI